MCTSIGTDGQYGDILNGGGGSLSPSTPVHTDLKINMEYW